MKKLIWGMALTILLPAFGIAQTPDAKEIVNRAENNSLGEKSSYCEMSMTIVRPKWERTLKMKLWTKARDKALTLITYPAKEKGQTFLKVGSNMWNWLPSINRMIKIPASMMSQGWMGSDYTNDDVLKESSLTNDYNHTLLGEEAFGGFNCYKIEMKPKPDAAVVWGKLITWISKSDYLMLKTEYYDEDGYLVRTEVASDVKEMGGRKVAAHIEIIPADKPNQKTVIVLDAIKFNIDLNDNTFSQQTMKTIK